MSSFLRNVYEPTDWQAAWSDGLLHNSCQLFFLIAINRKNSIIIITILAEKSSSIESLRNSAAQPTTTTTPIIEMIACVGRILFWVGAPLGFTLSPPSLCASTTSARKYFYWWCCCVCSCWLGESCVVVGLCGERRVPE